MSLSRNLKILGALITLYSVVFHYYMSQFLTAELWNSVGISAIVFFAVTFVTGLILGATDPLRKTRSDLAFQYHLATYIIVNSVGILWRITGLASASETWTNAAITIVAWGAGVILHRWLSAMTIKGMPKSTIFD